MRVDPIALRAHIRQLLPEIEGAVILSPRIRGHTELFLSLTGKKLLQIVARPDFSGIFLKTGVHPPKKRSGEWYSEILRNSVVRSTHMEYNILTIVLDKNGREIHLISEFTGRNANIILVNHKTGMIIDAIRRIDRTKNRFREILPGIRYVPPPENEFVEQEEVDPEPFSAILARHSFGEIHRVLTNTLCSGSRLFSSEVLFRTEIDRSRAAGSLTKDEALHILETAVYFREEIVTGDQMPILILDDEGIPQNLFPVDLKHVNDDRKRQVESLSDGLRELFSETINSSLRAEIRKYLFREIRRLEKIREKIIEKLSHENESERYRRMGEALLAFLQHVPRGANKVSLPDPERPDGHEIIIPLQPSLSPAENAGKLFTRARKISLGITHERRRLEEITKERNRLAEISEKANIIKDSRELRAIHRKLFGGERSHGYIDGFQERVPYREYRSSTGHRILVGKSGRDNDDLLKLARKNDLWLHAQGVPGAHVIIPGKGKSNRWAPDSKTLVEAATHAAKSSPLRTSKVAPVIYTLAKYVTKPKGAPPGTVRVMREKTIFVEI